MAGSDTTAGPLSQDDVGTLQDIIIGEVVNGIGLGVFMLLAIMGMYTLMRKGLRASIGRRFLMATIVILVLSSTTLFSSYLVYNIKVITLFGPSPVPSAVLSDLGIPLAISPRVNYFISDLIVVWRAWVLSDRRMFRIILAMCVLTTFGCMIPELLLTIRVLVNPSSNEKNPLLDLLMIVPLITTNVVATSIVAYKTWIYRTEIKVHSDRWEHRSGPGRIEKILVLLVESGGIYCGTWILALISTFTDSSHLFEGVMENIVPFFSGIYPLAIILLVERGKTDDMSTMGGSAISQSMRFASAPAHPVSQSGHSNSIIQSIADHIQSRRHDEESRCW